MQNNLCFSFPPDPFLSSLSFCVSGLSMNGSGWGKCPLTLPGLWQGCLNVLWCLEMSLSINTFTHITLVYNVIQAMCVFSTTEYHGVVLSFPSVSC